MPHENDIPANEQETGFGTGLRRQLERRRIDPHDGEHPVEPEAVEPEQVARDQQDEATETGERSEADELRLELEAALSREARLRTALIDHAQARERAEHLERELVAARAELAELRESRAAATIDAGLREFLRGQAVRHVDVLWSVFEQGLEAVKPDGTPDFKTRLEAARALLSEAYDLPDENGELPATQPARDDLAGRRARKIQQQQPL
jgi:predicted transcriptional regulator